MDNELFLRRNLSKLTPGTLLTLIGASEETLQKVGDMLDDGEKVTNQSVIDYEKKVKEFKELAQKEVQQLQEIKIMELEKEQVVLNRQVSTTREQNKELSHSIDNLKIKISMMEANIIDKDETIRKYQMKEREMLKLIRK